MKNMKGKIEMINNYDVVMLDNGEKEAVIKKIEVNGKSYLLCEKVINDELAMSFDIYRLEDDRFLDIDKSEKKVVLYELSKNTKILKGEQLKEFIKFLNNDLH